MNPHPQNMNLKGRILMSLVSPYIPFWGTHVALQKAGINNFRIEGTLTYKMSSEIKRPISP